MPDPPGDKTTLVEVKDRVRPKIVDLETDTVPVKPFRLAIVIMEVSNEPAGIVRDVGRAEMLKPTT